MANALICSVDEKGFTVETRDLAVTTGDELRAVIGGWLEAAAAGRGWVAYCDEEGKLKGQLVNGFAMHVMNLLGASHDTIVGNVIFLGANDEGNEVDVPNGLIDVAQAVLARMPTQLIDRAEGGA